MGLGKRQTFPLVHFYSVGPLLPSGSTFTKWVHFYQLGLVILQRSFLKFCVSGFTIYYILASEMGLGKSQSFSLVHFYPLSKARHNIFLYLYGIHSKNLQIF